MGNFKVISQETKEQVINRIKQEGVSVAQAAKDAGVSVQSVYAWLAKGVVSEPGILEVNKLKRENQFLLELVGKLTAEMERGKKKEKNKIIGMTQIILKQHPDATGMMEKATKTALA